MKARLQRRSEDDFGSLWSEALKCCHSLSARKDSMGSPGSTRSSNIRRANTTVQNGLYSKAIQALSSDGLASPSPAILEEMQDKHPQDMVQVQDLPASVRVTLMMLLTVLHLTVLPCFSYLFKGLSISSLPVRLHLLFSPCCVVLPFWLAAKNLEAIAL